MIPQCPACTTFDWRSRSFDILDSRSSPAPRPARQVNWGSSGGVAFFVQKKADCMADAAEGSSIESVDRLPEEEIC